jgi:pimeloyl-ACP methyl ester carboxylesterase
MPDIAAADLTVHYREAGSGAPVVFVHGNWTTSLSWQPTLDRLPAGWRGLAPDVRGRGATQGPDSDYTMPLLAADLRAFVDALGLDRFHLAGHSLGSAIALQFALEDGARRLQSLTMVAPAWVDGMPAAYNAPAAQQMLIDQPAVFRQALKAMMPTLPEGPLWEALVTEGHQQRPAATLRNLPALLDWRPGDSARAIGVPALVISGALDPLTGGANARRTAEALGAREVVMPGVGHSPNIEAPDAFGALLFEFLSAHAA